MFKSGLEFSTHDKFEKQKGKKKKQLSFRDPEVEGPHHSRANLFDARKSEIRRQDSSLEDLILEDQALQIAQSVGQAFSELSIHNTLATSENNLAGKATGPLSDNSFQKSMQLHKSQFFKDHQSLNENCPTHLVRSMKYPAIQTSTLEHESKEHQSGTHHQIQLLKYQLDQQSQQTQTALHQVQLLKDQMEAECAARLKVQNQNLQLMTQNKELLDHIEKLFQQIEDLENHIHVLEQERKSRKFPCVQELKTPELPGVSLENKKLNNNQIMQQSEGTYLQDKRITSGINQKQSNESKVSSPILMKKKSSGNIHEISTQIKPIDNEKANENPLKISDISPPVLNSTLNAFSVGWKSKIQEPIYQSNLEKSIHRTRTNSLSSSTRSKLPDGSRIRTSNSTIISNNFDIAEKSYSSSYSDLYNSSIFKSNKPLEIQYPFENKKSINNNKGKNKLKQSSSKMFCEQSDLVINDCGPLYLINKEDFKNSPETSLLFNR